MSQIVLTHVMTQQQLEDYTASVLREGDDSLPNEITEVPLAYQYDATPMICLGVMEPLEGIEVGEHVSALREQGITALIAWHHGDRARIAAILENLMANPEQLGLAYNEFYEQHWDEASEAMLEACRCLRSGLGLLSAERPWFLVFVS
jgi:hypothetical protein